jgi:hypothetical protein
MDESPVMSCTCRLDDKLENEFETDDQWFHTACMGISTSMYETLSNTSVSWTCNKCDTPNHTTILYESVMFVKF